ncbi:MAG: FAD binding domain-containing protein [Myxococcaceae bacterium]
MSLPKFSYLAPKSLAEACALLEEHGQNARLMAGGTDLLLKLSRTGRAPRFLVGLRAVAGLDYVRFDSAKGLSIGALGLLSSVAEHEEVRRLYPALAFATASTATVQIRNMGTVAGNLCNASPSADTATPLLVLGAEVVLQGAGGERVLPLERFFKGPGQTALGGTEVLREIRVPPPPKRSGSDYQRISERSQVDIAAVGVSALVELDEAGRCIRARLALGAVAPTPLRVPDAERALEGGPLDEERVARAAALAMALARPISDARAGAAWRKKMVEVLTGRAVRAAASAAGGSRR